MDDFRRNLILDVAAGERRALFFVFHIDLHQRSVELLLWLKRNGLVGQRLVEWAMNDCAGSPLKATAELVRRVEAEGAARAVLAKDLRRRA